MAFLKQNMNQFVGAPILGQVDLIPSPDTISAQFNPASTETHLQVTSLVKMITGASGAILVDVQTGPADVLPFGVIPVSERGNTYKAGDIITVLRSGYIYMRTSAAVVRGTNVSTTAATASSDPVVATDVTSGHAITGVAVDEASAADLLIRINLKFSILP